MRGLVIALALLGCKGGEEEARRDIELQEARQAEERRLYEKEMAPLHALQKRYDETAAAAIAAHAPRDGAADIALAKGRKIAPVQASTTYPDGERRPTTHLWCPGRCDKEPWIAPDVASAGVLVIADVQIIEGGKWVSTGYAGDKKELGNAYIHQYDVRAILVPEDVVVARWTRYGMIPGISNHELMPVRPEEMTADFAALQVGTAPAAKGREPKTRIGDAY